MASSPLSPPAHRPTEPALRRALPAAALARPEADRTSPEVWREVARCLEGSSAAVACTLDGTDPSVCAVLASCALAETSRAAALLAADAPALRPRSSWGGGTVEQTWAQLVELLLDPEPVEPVLLADALERHRSALLAWRRVLLGPVRVRRRQHAAGRAV